MTLLVAALLTVWVVAPLIFGWLYWRCALTIRYRVKQLGLSSQAGLVGRDYIIQAAFGLAVAALFEGTTLLAVLAPDVFATAVVSSALLLLIPLMFLAHAIFLHWRVVGQVSLRAKG